ncbi:unnamed protein product [Mytilus coruscus]|uniref:MYND-type domain-containing protein n=1 Tax=Mytilus coruscus TaxID=42192 RepID=A0A6J8AT58_MYTCO|nr:unnamed protein product [Mytilus coruscus]
MASNTIFECGGDVTEELKTEITQICESGPNTPVINADLEDHQKRWLITGIGIHSVLSPTLRKYIEPVVSNLYNSLQQTHGIQTQTYPKQLKKCPNSGRELNCEAINNNRLIPRVHRKPDVSKYDYKVTNHVEFSKLFLKTFMAQYTALDDTCDLSALLGIILSIDKFPQTVRNVASKVRSDVRNPWAHCNFDEWDSLKYQTAFKLLNQLVICLQLSTADEADILAELTNWEGNGFRFLQGYAVTHQFVKEIRRQTSVLADYSLKMKSGVDVTFIKVHDALFKVNGEIMLACSRIDNIESKQNKQEMLLDTIHEDVTVLYDRTLVFENTNKRVSKLENEHLKIKEDISHIKTDITEMKDGINKKYMPMSEPRVKTFFYPPNRSKAFVARETELCKIKDSCIAKCNRNYNFVICGLGGCGKTTLAIEFAWQSQEFYPAGIFWMSAETQHTLEDSFATLAIDVDTTGKDFQETFKKTLKWFSSLNGRWLLVVDNVDDEYLSDSTKELLIGTWTRNTRGHIIITSRREPNEIEESMAVKSESCICLNVFETQEGLDFLRRRTGIHCNNDDDTVMSLVEELGGLPLALEQAAAHIKSIKCSFNNYVSKFKKERLKLLKAAPSLMKINKSRLAIATTWQLNIDYITRQSENEGLGKAAVTIMKIASYLFADDIPKELINIGSPLLEDKNLVDVLDDEMGCSQIIEILTRFSLFQRLHGTSLSVHRLVQEVIRDNMEIQHRFLILQHPIRMVKKALDSSQSPVNVLYDKNGNEFKRGSLVKWGKFAANANTIKVFVSDMKKNENLQYRLFYNTEMLKILQTTALYHNIHQRQALALADQELMVRIMTTLPVDENNYNDLTRIKIPLQQKDRETISGCLVSVLPEEKKDAPDNRSVIISEVDTLRTIGNDKFRVKMYSDTFRYYIESMRSYYPFENPESTFFSKRYLNRIRDSGLALTCAYRYIRISSENLKGCQKSYNYSPCLLEYNMTTNCPIINYKMVDRSEFLQQELISVPERQVTTLLVRKGLYLFTEPIIITKSIQVIAIEDGVEFDIGPGFHICRISKHLYTIDCEPEQTINAYFENINFISGNQITVKKDSTATFYKCKFSNGQKGCDAFPKCTGNLGCINQMTCKQVYQEKRMVSGFLYLGQPGYAGIGVYVGGIAHIDSCVLKRCGGGGVLSHGKGSLIEIKNSTVQNMRQMGVEARDGGAIKVIKNIISENQFHGVAIGPNGYGYISENIIQANGAEGIRGGGLITSITWAETDEEGASRAVIIDNIIRGNGLCGVSCDGGIFEIKGNRIFSNFFWGMMVKLRSSAYITKNEIFDYKCGGIRIGKNFTASVIIDGNIIRDHIGPGIYIVNSADIFRNKLQATKPGICIGNGEVLECLRPPIITSTNHLENNEKGTQHPIDIVRLVEVCSFCRQISQNLKSCSKCKKATYCSKNCQSKHWSRHKHMCKLLNNSYVVKVKMAETEPNNIGVPPKDREPNQIYTRKFNPKLEGISEGVSPDTNSCKRFIVKIQTGKEYGFYDPNTKIFAYDQTVSLDIQFSNPTLYHLCMECGVLAGEKFTVKKIFCWASFENKGKTLCFYTDNLPPFQKW